MHYYVNTQLKIIVRGSKIFYLEEKENNHMIIGNPGKNSLNAKFKNYI